MEELFLRIALCDTDEKFEIVLERHLVSVIEALETHQQKALEIITHVKKRVASLHTVQLPVTKLFELLESDSPSPTVTMFSTLFLKIGVPRVPPTQTELLCDVLSRCLAQSQRDDYFFTLWSTNLAAFLQSSSAQETSEKVEMLLAKVESHLKDKNRFDKLLLNLQEHILSVLTVDIQPVACISPQNRQKLIESRTNKFTKTIEVSEEDLKREKASVAKFVIHWTSLPVDKAVFFLTLLNYLSPSGNAESALRKLDYSVEDDKLRLFTSKLIYLVAFSIARNF